MAQNNRHKQSPDVCPVCGEDVPDGALARPGCGSDHDTGWNEDAKIYDGIDLPDRDFNYQDFIKKEFGNQKHCQRIKPMWWIVAVFVLGFIVWISVCYVF